MHIFNIQLPLSPFKSNGGQKCLNSQIVCTVQNICPDQFFQVIALKAQFNKISRAFDYKKKPREPAEEGLQSLHCADCHGESYYISNIFLHIYFAYCYRGTFYPSYVYVVYEINVSLLWSLSQSVQ